MCCCAAHGVHAVPQEPFLPCSKLTAQCWMQLPVLSDCLVQLAAPGSQCSAACRHASCGLQLHGSRCTRNAVKALFNAFESQSTLSEMQRSLGNYRVRELAVGAGADPSKYACIGSVMTLTL